MKTIHDNKEIIDKSEPKTLEVFCSDSIEVKARVTFDSCEVDGIQVTYWQDDGEDTEKRIDAIFNILFTEMVESRK